MDDPNKPTGPTNNTVRGSTLHDEETTAFDLVENPDTQILWKGTVYSITINEDAKTITLEPKDDTVTIEKLSFETVSDKFQQTTELFNTYNP